MPPKGVRGLVAGPSQRNRIRLEAAAWMESKGVVFSSLHANADAFVC